MCLGCWSSDDAAHPAGAEFSFVLEFGAELDSLGAISLGEATNDILPVARRKRSNPTCSKAY